MTEVVTAIDGCPTIVVSDISGEKHVVALIRKQTKVIKNLMYNVFQIPNDPIVPLSKHGATTMMRMFSSEADIAAGKPRPRYLRSIPLNDPDGETPPKSSLYIREHEFVDALNAFSQVNQRPQTRTTDSGGIIHSLVTPH